MKRLRKYRAFDKDTKKMHYFSDQHSHGICEGDWMIDFQGNVWERQSGTGGDFIPDNVELIEYTGFTDQRGNAWYEGDIIKMKQGEQQKKESAYECFGKIVFRQGSFMIMCQNASMSRINIYDINGNFEVNDYYETASRTKVYEVAFDFEVIGNIFENPELLESLTPLPQ